MCGPAIPIVAGGVAAAGALVGGYQALQQGNYESQVAKQNADLATEAALDSINRGRDEAKGFYRQVGQVKGDQNASLAANGIDVGYGTAGVVQDDTRALATEDAGNLYANVHERTRGFSINAMNARAEATAAKTRGRSAAIGSVFEAGSSLMGGFQQTKLLKAKFGTVR